MQQIFMFSNKIFMNCLQIEAIDISITHVSLALAKKLSAFYHALSCQQLQTFS